MNGLVRIAVVVVAVVVCAIVVGRLVGAHMVRDIRASALSNGLMALTSPAFVDGGDIPAKYAGRSVSPPLSWSGPPAGTKSLALVAVDEGPTPIGLPITHWVVFNIPTTSCGLDEGVPNQARLANGTVQGWNWARRNAYIGPEPPWGQHLYSFTIYALDSKLDLGPATNRPALMRAVEGHVLAAGRLAGYYARQ